MQNVTAPRRAGWLTTLIQQARTRGLDNRDIAAALEGAVAFRPVTIARDGGDRLVGLMMDDDLTVADLFTSPDEDRPPRGRSA